MIDASRWTKHERGVILAALLNYGKLQGGKAKQADTLAKRRTSKANAFVADDCVRQIGNT